MKSLFSRERILLRYLYGINRISELVGSTSTLSLSIKCVSSSVFLSKTASLKGIYTFFELDANGIDMCTDSCVIVTQSFLCKVRLRELRGDNVYRLKESKCSKNTF